jgi:hypothetical protein
MGDVAGLAGVLLQVEGDVQGFAGRPFLTIRAAFFVPSVGIMSASLPRNRFSKSTLN